MTDLAVDPAPFLRADPAEDPAGPLIYMVVSLTFPGMDRAAHDLQDELTRIAFAAVRDAGGRPRLVDSAAESLHPHAPLLEQADGFIFLGGGDVDVDCYGYDGPLPSNLYGIDRRADDYCLDLIRRVTEKDLPLLALCRGSQLLNVAFGGTLIPDIADWGIHKGPGSPLFINERLTLEPGSRLAEALGRTDVTVRNGHHQAVDQVAPELRVTARAADGIVEGTEHRTASWIVGAQWHPEERDADVADRARIFGAFVDQAREQAATKGRETAVASHGD